MTRTRFALFLLLGAAGLAAAPRGAAAQPAPLGPEVRVDTLAGDQIPNNPKLEVQRDGTFEVTWDYGGSQPASIFARHFNAAAHPTDNSQVLLGGEGFWPKVDAITKAGKGYDVLWHINKDIGAPPAFYTRHLDARGALVGKKPLKVGKPFLPYMWFLAGDGLVGGSYASAIKTFELRKVSPNGVPTLQERRINVQPLDSPTPWITPLSSGGFVGVLRGNTVLPADGMPRPVLRARLFKGTFEPMGIDFDINSLPAGPDGTAPVLGVDYVVAANPGGGFAVAWTLGNTLYLRFFDAAGHATGPEVPAVIHDGTFAPLSAAIDKNGNLLLLWFEILGDPPRGNLQIELFNAQGLPLGPPEDLNSAASGRYLEPFAGSVATAGSSWLVAWAAQVDDLEPSAIFVRRYAPQ
ncbi:MAG TPA: hypothetical protein VGS07_22230 [Thermoanaerobaculia bacterium]|jgi:hypothetical protein|nr:hypothetical protein [Thermoanaerobaculia bacterium]